MDTGGWRPLKLPKDGAEAFEITPFTRLARAHALAVAGDTLIAIALAGSLFFSIDPSAARSRVFLYLALTMAPFAVVAPLVGPALDRTPGGRRMMVVGSSGLRAVVCLLMIDDIDSLLLFPEAFALLVLAKSYQVAKSALVPTVVHREGALVDANSKLSVISGVVGFAAAVPGGILYRFGGSSWVLGLAMLVFAAGVVVSLQIPKTAVAVDPATRAEIDELRGAGVLLAATAMGLLRGVVGFLTFLLAFALRTDDAPSWHFAVVVAVSALTSLAGAAVAPAFRRMATEERIIALLLAAVAACSLLSAWGGGLFGAALVAGSVGLAAAGAKQAFDAIVQRDAPDANRGRSFARFETRFQMTWVVGAIIGIVPMPLWLGFVAVAGVSGFAAVSYSAGAGGARAATLRRLAARRSRGGDDAEVDTQPGVDEAPTPAGDEPATGSSSADVADDESAATVGDAASAQQDAGAADGPVEENVFDKPTRAFEPVSADDLVDRPTRELRAVDPDEADDRPPGDGPTRRLSPTNPEADDIADDIAPLPPTVVTPNSDPLDRRDGS